MHKIAVNKVTAKVNKESPLGQSLDLKLKYFGKCLGDSYRMSFWKCEPMSVASAVSVAVLHASATAGGEWHRVYVQRECVPVCLCVPNAFSLSL